MSEITPEMQFIKEKMKGVWSAGDFGVIAKIIEHEGENFINRLNIKPGSKVLDVACGTGNLALPAARLGANVTGLDLVSDLISQANDRAKAENLNVKFDVGDAESMPYSDNEFDYVVTMFGAMFAPRPDIAACELLRVCKPGGIIAMANWTPDGFIGKFFRLGASFLPPPPGVPAPTQWGVDEIVKQRFGNRVSQLKLTSLMCRQDLGMPANDAAEHFIKYFGPTKTLYGMIDDGKRAEFKREFTKLWLENNISSDGIVIVDSEYLEVTAVKNLG